MRNNMMTGREIKILGILCDKAQWKNVFMDRCSDREFDVDIFANDSPEIRWRISSWMPLAIIKNVNWKDKRIWGLIPLSGDKGCIPSQVNDWSRIRNSSREAIWQMMNVAIEMLETGDNCQQKKIDEAVGTLGIMLSTFKTKTELIEWVVGQNDSYITHMTVAYMILTDMI